LFEVETLRRGERSVRHGHRAMSCGVAAGWAGTWWRIDVEMPSARLISDSSPRSGFRINTSASDHPHPPASNRWPSDEALATRYACGMKQSITRFMWGYQQHFRSSFERQAERVLKEVAPDLTPEVLLVGVRVSEGAGFDVCVEPEDGKWSLDLFEDLKPRIDALYAAHPRQEMVYTHGPTMDRKPAEMRSDATREAVQERMSVYDRASGRVSFCGPPGRVWHKAVGEYDVVPVLQFDRAVFEKYRRLKKTSVGGGYDMFSVVPSLVDAIIEILLREIRREFRNDDPGSLINNEFHRDGADILREAARQLMNRVGWVNSDAFGLHGLFEICSTIASLRHESSESVGGLVIARADHPSVTPIVRFRQPIPLRTPNWTRKVLELTSDGVYLLCDTVNIYGLGAVGPYDGESEDLFVVEFTGFHRWDLRHGSDILMRTSFGVPGLPASHFDRDRFIENLRQRFREMSQSAAEAIWVNVDTATEQKKGAMVMISRNAAAEAARLSGQATAIDPLPLTPALVRQLTGIDGALLLDMEGDCHAIGVIFDGQATADGSPARGSRFNSALRYVNSSNGAALAVVISEDGSFDVLPLLRRRVRKSEVDAAVADLRKIVDAGNIDALPEARARLQALRFYFTAEQCASINEDLSTLREKVISAHHFWVVMSDFVRNPEMSDDYFADE
jgi:hypothetical protein